MVQFGNTAGAKASVGLLLGNGDEEVMLEGQDLLDKVGVLLMIAKVKTLRYRNVSSAPEAEGCLKARSSSRSWSAWYARRADAASIVLVICLEAEAE